MTFFGCDRMPHGATAHANPAWKMGHFAKLSYELPVTL